MSKIKDCSTCQNSVLSKTDSEAECKCAHCVLNTCKPCWNGDIGYYEPFEFNVGDYIELKDSSVGYIKYISRNKNECWIYGYLPNDKYVDEIPCFNFRIHCHYDDIFKYFKRIGKYDFTEQPGVKKINHLEYGHTEKRKCTRVEIKSEDYPNTAPVKYVDELNDVYIKTDTTDIIKKLNEVIDRVNEL